MAYSTVLRWDFVRENVPLVRNPFEQIFTWAEIYLLLSNARHTPTPVATVAAAIQI